MPNKIFKIKLYTCELLASIKILCVYICALSCGICTPHLFYKLSQRKKKSMACSPSSITSVLSTCLTLLLISFCLKRGHALEEIPAAESNFYSVHVSSLLPSLICKPSSSTGHFDYFFLLSFEWSLYLFFFFFSYLKKY